MRKLLVISLGLFAIASTINGAPKNCKNVRCHSTSQQQCELYHKQFISAGSLDACCDLCLEAVDPGGSCGPKWMIVEGGLRRLIHPKCRDGAVCVNNSRGDRVCEWDIHEKH